MEINIIKRLTVIIFCLALTENLIAQKTKEEEIKEKIERVSEKAKIDVIGENKNSLKKIPGSATVINKKILDEVQPVDAMEILRRVPGVSLRYMDSAGLTPNVSFRGVSNEEARKTLFLEDGVLTSLSPYGQPESYYFPNIDRMARVEIVKGSGSILFGPSTIGGIINFVTRKPPKTPTFSNKSIGGENGFFSNMIQYGGTWGKTSIDASYLHKRGDGYRDYNYFNVNDFYFKISHEINEKHTVSLKLGHNDQKAQATYHGVTQGLFWRDRRINPARFDLKEVERSSAVLSHEYTINSTSRVVTKLYITNSRRDWQRQDFGYNNLTEQGTPALPPSDLFATYAPAPIGNRAGDIMYMRGTAPMRNQGFNTLGIESKLETSFTLLNLKHELDFGVRAHGEMNKINFKQSYPPLNYPFIREGIPFSQQDRTIRAYAIYLQNRISITDKFKIIPGLRYEYVSQGVYTKRRKATARDVRDRIATNVGDILLVDRGTESFTKILLPGLGITYDFTNDLSLFAGVHKSFSPPTFGTAISPFGEDYRLGAETATNYETGIRGDIKQYLNFEAAVFFMNFRDQVIDTAEVSNEVGTRPINTGKSSHKGFELSSTFDFGKFFNSKLEIPLDIIYSHINAKNETYEKYPHVIDIENRIQFISRPAILIDQNGRLINPDTNGRYLPYVPEDTYTIGQGIRFKNGFYARAEYQYISKQYSSLSAYRNLKPGPVEIRQVQGISYAYAWNTNDETPDGNTGIIPAYGLVNASLGFKHPDKKWSIFIVGKNLQDRSYVSGRLPIGIHPGPTRQINIGFSIEF
ncbi:MAG: TonB-dependent receptor [Leptospiraceae bacterium]|nr:TonB-dependent receptor [Leptospiraceae bacterium]